MRQLLEAVVRPAVEFMCRLLLPHDEQVLDPDAEAACFVVAGLVGADHAWLERYHVGVARRDRVWALVHIECCAYAVPGAVQVVEPR